MPSTCPQIVAIANPTEGLQVYPADIPSQLRAVYSTTLLTSQMSTLSAQSAIYSSILRTVIVNLNFDHIFACPETQRIRRFFMDRQTTTGKYHNCNRACTQPVHKVHERLASQAMLHPMPQPVQNK